MRHLVGHPDVLRDVGHDGLDVRHADGHLRPAWDVRRILPRWIAVDADWIFPSMPRLRRLFELVRVKPGAFLLSHAPRLALALLPRLHRALALFPARDSLDALRDFLCPLCVRFRRPEAGSVRLDRAADCPVPQRLNPRVDLPQRRQDLFLLIRENGRVREFGLDRRLALFVEQVAVVEPGGYHVVHEQSPRLSFFLGDAGYLADGGGDGGVHALLGGDVRLLRPTRAGLLGAA